MSLKVVGKSKKMMPRRSFFKGVIAGGAFMAGAAGLIMLADSVIVTKSPQEAYLNDVLPGDKIIGEMEHVVMSDREKGKLVKMFEENYRK